MRTERYYLYCENCYVLTPLETEVVMMESRCGKCLPSFASCLFQQNSIKFVQKHV